jgi:hypothetical protein
MTSSSFRLSNSGRVIEQAESVCPELPDKFSRRFGMRYANATSANHGVTSFII